jgi:DNA-binding NtrC family response regulator
LRADVRVIAATNRPPKEALEAGKLREDLYYRLAVFHIVLPPLRERTDDIALLVESMIASFNAQYGTRVVAPGKAALDRLCSRRWAGNVRELRNVIERAVILAGSGPLDDEHLSAGSDLTEQGSPARVDAPRDDLDIRVGMTVDEAERALIEATLRRTSNNKTQAAVILGISAKTLHAKLRAYRQAGDEEPDSE